MNDEEKKKMACGLYLRVSTERQVLVKEGSLETQLGTLTKYTEIKTDSSDEEWYVAQVYREEGKTGKNTDRPEYQQMLRDIEDGKLDVLLCTRIDRVNRSLIDFYHLHGLLEKNDVRFVSLNENWDTSSPMGRFGLKLTLAVAELEREQTSQRTKQKLRWRAEEGLWNGGQVFGYDLNPDERGILFINAEEAKIVLIIFETYRRTHSLRMTARKVNELGFRTKSYKSRRGFIHGNRKFTKTAITHILQNSVYIGKVSHTGDEFEGKHEAIIDERLWQDVQDILARNRIVKAKPRQQNMHVFLLEGLLRCGSCGSYLTPTYSGGRNGTYFYYICTKANNGADECRMNRVSAEAIEDVIVRRILEIARDRNLLEQAVEDSSSSYKKESRLLEDRLNLQKKALMPIKQAIQNIVEFITQGKGSPTLARELEKLEVQKKQIDGEIDNIRSEIQEMKSSSIDTTTVKEGLDFFDQVWDLATPEQKKDLLRLYIHKIIYTPDKIKMGLNMRPISEYERPTASVNHEGDFAVDRIKWLPSIRS